jgi:hypothetical protein
MAPLLVTALVGIGVKLATDLLMSGAKEMFKSNDATSTFAAALDKARTPGATAALAAPKTVATDAALAERSRVLAAEPSALPATGFGHGTEAYRRLTEIQAL